MQRLKWPARSLTFYLILLVGALLWILISILILSVIPGGPAFERVGNFAGSALATFLGLFFGGLLAMDINARKDNAEKERRGLRIIGLIKEELDFNRRLIENPERRLEMLFQAWPLKDETWTAILEGGELKWLKDLELLDTCVQAYYFIKTAKGTEAKLLENPGWKQYYKSYLLKELYPAIQSSLDNSLKTIDASGVMTIDLR